MEEQLSNDEEKDIQVINPLLDPYILDEIFSYLEVPDLLACRNFNLTWISCATNRLSQVKERTFNSGDEMEQFMNVMAEGAATRGTFRLPITKYNLSPGFFQSNPNPQQIFPFLDIHGDMVESLELNFPSSSSLLDVDDIPGPNFNSSLDSLSKLTFVFIEEHQPISPAIIALVSFILSRARRLEFLKVAIRTGGMLEEQDLETRNSINKVFSIIISGGIIRGGILKSFHLFMDITEEQAMVLADKISEVQNLPLRHLSLRGGMWESVEIQDSAAAIVQPITLSLTQLILDIREVANLRLPICPNLEKLGVKIAWNLDSFQKFLHSFPNLKTLSIRGLSNDNNNKGGNTVSLSLLDRLNVPILPNDILNGLLLRFGASLTHLAISIHPDQGDILRRIFRDLGATLEYFHLDVVFLHGRRHIGYTMDSLLTGISREDCVEFLRGRGIMGQTMDNNVTLSNLRQLKKLHIGVSGMIRTVYPRPLTLESQIQSRSVTDVTMKLAILRMPQLRKCRILRSCVTDECLQLPRVQEIMDKTSPPAQDEMCPHCFVGFCTPEDCHHD